MLREIVRTDTGERLGIKSVNRLLNGKTIITSKTSDLSLVHWGKKIGVESFAWVESVPCPDQGYQLSKFAVKGDDGVWRQRWEEVIQTSEGLLIKKIESIRSAANRSYEEPVIDSNGRNWNGGIDSAGLIKNATDLAEFMGNTHVSIFDIENKEHTLTLNEAKVVAATIGSVYQLKFAAKQAAMRALSAIDLTSDSARQQMDDIAFEVFYIP